MPTKFALVIPDGAADEPQAELGGLSPLEAAHIPNMDDVARLGQIGRTNNVPSNLPSGSDVGTLSLFGYNPNEHYSGRAPLEAAAQNIELQPGDWAIRCNLVQIEEHRMASFTAGQFPSDAAKLLIEILQHEFCGDPHWKFHPGVSYRNLLVYRSRGQTPPFAIQTLTTPPHDITGQHIEPHLPTGPGSDLLRQLMDRSRTLFAKAPPNLARAASNLPQATQIWLWGLGSQPVLQPFLQRYNVRGAVITAVDLLRGIGKLLGWKIINVPGATGYLDTDYAAKGRAAIETLAQPDVDFVVVHVEATDEASHEGNAREKIHALEQIDQHIVGPLHNWLKTQSNYRLLICPDHPTFLRTRTHSHGFCPFAWCGTGIPHSGYTEYHEKNANLAHLCFHDGFNLIRNFLHQ